MIAFGYNLTLCQKIEDNTFNCRLSFEHTLLIQKIEVKVFYTWKLNLNYSTMAQQTAIVVVLTTCSFTAAAQRAYIMGSEGLDRWLNFTLLDFDDLNNIAKSASRHTTSFTIGVLKLKCLHDLKFWIEDRSE